MIEVVLMRDGHDNETGLYHSMHAAAQALEKMCHRFGWQYVGPENEAIIYDSDVNIGIAQMREPSSSER